MSGDRWNLRFQTIELYLVFEKKAWSSMSGRRCQLQRLKRPGFEGQWR